MKIISFSVLRKEEIMIGYKKIQEVQLADQEEQNYFIYVDYELINPNNPLKTLKKKLNEFHFREKAHSLGEAWLFRPPRIWWV